jgi:NAD(P)H-flavin reductase
MLKDVRWSRQIPYWVTVITATWILAINIGWNTDKGYTELAAMLEPVSPKTSDLPLLASSIVWRIQDAAQSHRSCFSSVRSPSHTTCLPPFLDRLQLSQSFKNATAVDWMFIYVHFVVPLLLAALVSYLCLSPVILPAHKWRFVTRCVAYFRKFPLSSAEEGHQIAKKNQFLKGEVNFDVMALWLVGIPIVLGFAIWMPVALDYTHEEAAEFGWDEHRVMRERTFTVSMMTGFFGIVALSWFLIPVARHSVLLVAMGWSPVQALRMHIWAGHVCFFFVFIHALTMIIVFFMDPYPIYQHFIPPKECWGWNAMNAEIVEDLNETALVNETSLANETSSRMLAEAGEFEITCNWQWYNLTGIVAMIIFIVLWVSSLHWFRRRNYRLFYLIHVSFGTLTLLSSLVHYAFMVMYWLPSILYYLGSTSPTLVQALASRYRGGVKITKVVPIQDAAGCVEVHVGTNEEAAVELNHEPSQFVKLCVPKISIVWHPFTVFAHPADPKTLRFLFRPVGPFTKSLADALVADSKPVTMLDGFYRGSNRCEEAAAHDNVTIVSGGVALTPFLSMIPALLGSISKKADNGGDSCYTQTISLHWSCREKGLLKYVFDNYLSLFLDQARAMGKVKLEVTVYYTGKEGGDSLKDTAADAGALSKENLDKNEATLNSNEETASFDDDSGSCKPSSNTASENEQDNLDVVANGNATAAAAVAHDDGTDKISSEQKSDDASTMDNMPSHQGHPMEVGRMMSGRFHKLYQRLPLFLAFAVPLFCGWAILNETYDWNREENFHQMVNTAFFTVVVVLMYFFFGLMVEGVMLHAPKVLNLEKYFPPAKLDSFDVYCPVPAMSSSASSSTESGSTFASILESKMEDEFTSFKVVMGRPTGAMVLESASVAEAPGIFLCGPQAMVKMVKEETNKENRSWLGKTRYCLYNEEFDM